MDYAWLLVIVLVIALVVFVRKDLRWQKRFEDLGLQYRGLKSEKRIDILLCSDFRRQGESDACIPGGRGGPSKRYYGRDDVEAVGKLILSNTDRFNIEIDHEVRHWP